MFPDYLSVSCNYDVTYIKKRYGNCPTIVSDGGCEVASTKVTAHLRQAKYRIGKTVRLHLNNQLSMSKSDFLLKLPKQAKLPSHAW